MSNTANNFRKRMHAVGLYNMKRAIAYGVEQKGERDVMRRASTTLKSIEYSLIDRLIWWDMTPEGHSYWENISLQERRRVF